MIWIDNKKCMMMWIKNKDAHKGKGIFALPICVWSFWINVFESSSTIKIKILQDIFLMTAVYYF